MEEEMKELKELLDRASVLIRAIEKDAAGGISARDSMIEEQRAVIENRNNTITALVEKVRELERKLTIANACEKNIEEERHEQQRQEQETIFTPVHSLYIKESLAPVWMLDKPGPFVEDIREAISLNDRLIYINDLFGGDVAVYEDMIVRINEMPSLSEALDYARSMFPNWDEGSDSVYRFYMTVRRRF